VFLESESLLKEAVGKVRVQKYLAKNAIKSKSTSRNRSSGSKAEKKTSKRKCTDSTSDSGLSGSSSDLEQSNVRAFNIIFVCVAYEHLSYVRRICCNRS
jgi:hypothetical protein